MESISSNFIAFCDTEKIYSLQLLLIEYCSRRILHRSALALAEMDWRLRRPSSVVDVALRARRDAFIATKASPARRASIASFMATAPGFKAAVVERVVMLKLKENAGPHEVAAMLDALHALRKLDGVQELTVGTALSVQGGDYTHVMHGRFRDKKALGAFVASPDHAAIVRKFIRPLVEDSITADWECRPCGPCLDSIMAKRITLIKLKKGTSPADLRFLEESIPHLPSMCPTIGQASAGMIFPSEKAKEFGYGILELFPSTEDDEEVFASVEHIAWQDTKLRPIAASLLLADFHASGY